MNAQSLVSNSNPLKKRIMRRVYAVWFWKSIAPLLAVELILIAGVTIGVLTHVSLRSIMANAFGASSGVKAFILFFVNNFFVKSIQSRLLVAVFGALVGFFIRDFASALRRMRRALKEDMLAAAFSFVGK